MSESLTSTYRPILEAIAFAARAHRSQLRKDQQTPYASHAFRVCLVVRQVFGISDVRVLTAAVLHDTIEDTNTDFDDLAETFDSEIASWVALLSKDKRQEFESREEAYCAALARAPWQVQVCKLADIFDNLLDLESLSRDKRTDALEKKRRYLRAIQSDLRPEAAAAWDLTSQLVDELEGELKK